MKNQNPFHQLAPNSAVFMPVSAVKAFNNYWFLFASHNRDGMKMHSTKRLAMKVAKRTGGSVSVHHKMNGVNVLN